MTKCQPIGTTDSPAEDLGFHWLERVKADVGEVDRQLQTKDFVGINERLRHLEEEVRNAAEESIPDLQRQIWGMIAFMGTEPVCSTAREQEKWVAAGFDRSLIITDPEAVHFAVSSKLIYTISMYAKSSGYLDGESMTIRSAQGKALFKIEGMWKPYASFKDQIRYSEERKSFLGWNCIHPEGFVPRDWVEYDRIYPVARLNGAGVLAAAAHAQTFWGKDQPEVDPGTEKPWVLQVIATKREPATSPWWRHCFQEQGADRHTSFRVIAPNGELYSFGIAVRREDEAFFSSPEHFLATVLANVPIPDYEEPRKVDGRTMVALPLSEARAKRILDFASDANKGIPFNAASQNCARFAETILQLAGVAAPSRIPIRQLLSDSIASCACPLPFVKHVWKVFSDAAGEAAFRAAACIANGIALAFFGAGASTGPRRLLSWKDLLSPEAIEVYSPARLEQWMLGQSNVIVQRN